MDNVLVAPKYLPGFIEIPAEKLHFSFTGKGGIELESTLDLPIGTEDILTKTYYSDLLISYPGYYKIGIINYKKGYGFLTEFVLLHDQEKIFEHNNNGVTFGEKVSASFTPTNAEHLTNKAYVDQKTNQALDEANTYTDDKMVFRMRYRGDFSSGNIYNECDVVRYLNGLYSFRQIISPLPCPLPTDTVYWDKIGVIDLPPEDLSKKVLSLVNNPIQGSGVFQGLLLTQEKRLKGYGIWNTATGGFFSATLFLAGDFSTNIPYPQWKFKEVVVGRDNVYAIAEDGNVFVMGNNDTGQLGTGNTTDLQFLTQLSFFMGSTRVKKIIPAPNSFNFSVGACFFITEGSEFLYACGLSTTRWGNPGSESGGYLGTNQGNVNVPTPTQVGSMFGWKAVSPSTVFGHCLGIVGTDRRLYSWGRNNKGALGTGNTTIQTTPFNTNLTNIAGCLAVSQRNQSALTDMQYSLAWNTSGQLFFAGEATNGQKGDGTTTQLNTFTQISSGGLSSEFVLKAVAPQSFNATVHVLTQSGKIFTTGFSTQGQTARNVTTQQNTYGQALTEAGFPNDKFTDVKAGMTGGLTTFFIAKARWNNKDYLLGCGNLASVLRAQTSGNLAGNTLVYSLLMGCVWDAITDFDITQGSSPYDTDNNVYIIRVLLPNGDVYSLGAGFHSTFNDLNPKASSGSPCYNPLPQKVIL